MPCAGLAVARLSDNIRGRALPRPGVGQLRQHHGDRVRGARGCSSTPASAPATWPSGWSRRASIPPPSPPSSSPTSTPTTPAGRPRSRKVGVRLFGSRGTYAAAGFGAVEIAGYEVLEPGVPHAIGALTVTGIAVPHDAAGPMAFVTTGGGCALGHATDFGHVGPRWSRASASATPSSSSRTTTPACCARARTPGRSRSGSSAATGTSPTATWPPTWARPRRGLPHGGPRAPLEDQQPSRDRAHGRGGGASAAQSHRGRAGGHRGGRHGLDGAGSAASGPAQAAAAPSVLEFAPGGAPGRIPAPVPPQGNETT